MRVVSKEKTVSTNFYICYSNLVHYTGNRTTQDLLSGLHNVPIENASSKFHLLLAPTRKNDGPRRVDILQLK